MRNMVLMGSGLLLIASGILLASLAWSQQRPEAPPNPAAAPTCEERLKVSESRLREWQEKGPGWIGAIMDGNSQIRLQQDQLLQIQTQDAQHVKERDEALEKVKQLESAAPVTHGKNAN
jgi:hypothetical protein